MSNSPILRLMRRRGVLWDLALTILFAVILSLVGVKLGLRIFGSSSELGNYVAPEALGFHTCLLIGAVIGVVANFAMQDLLYDRFSWTLPQLGKKLKLDLWWLALLSCVLGGISGWLLQLWGQGPGLLLGASSGLLGFGLGNQQWDPKIGRNFCFICQAILLLLVVSAEQVVAQLETQPWLLAPLALAFTYFSIQRSTRREGLRKRALVPTDQLGASFEKSSRSETASIAKRNLKNGAPIWKSGLIGNQAQRQQALSYEQFGWAKGRWIGLTVRSTLMVLLWLALLSLAVFLLGDSTEISLADGISAGALVGPMMFLLFTPVDWSRAILYPLSRRQRADLLWKANLHKGFSTLMIAAVVLLVPRSLLMLLADGGTALGNLEITLAAILALSVFVPASQWCRLRWVDSQQLSANSARFVFILTALLCSFMVVVNLVLLLIQDLNKLLSQGDSNALTVVALLTIPMSWLACQLVFRHQIRRFILKADL